MCVCENHIEVQKVKKVVVALFNDVRQDRTRLDNTTLEKTCSVHSHQSTIISLRLYWVRISAAKWSYEHVTDSWELNA